MRPGFLAPVSHTSAWICLKVFLNLPFAWTLSIHLLDWQTSWPIHNLPLSSLHFSLLTCGVNSCDFPSHWSMLWLPHISLVKVLNSLNGCVTVSLKHYTSFQETESIVCRFNLTPKPTPWWAQLDFACPWDLKWWRQTLETVSELNHELKSHFILQMKTYCFCLNLQCTDFHPLDNVKQHKNGVWATWQMQHNSMISSP